MNLIRAIIAVIFVLFVVQESFASGDDGFIRGYAAAVLEREFHVTLPSLRVEDGIIRLNSEEIQAAERERIITELLNIKGVKRVELTGREQEKISETVPAVESQAQEQGSLKASEQDAHEKTDQSRNRYLFAPLIADPRWPHFSMSYQHYTDNGELTNVFAASFGETLPLYQDDAPFGGQWQLAVQAAGFISHDLETASWDLINEDYFGGLSFFYRRDALSGLLGIYHNSSHVGDEFLLNNNVDRVNLSYEAIQLKVSYDFSESFRGYLGGDYMFSPDPKDLKKWITQYGLEYYSPRTYFKGWFRPVAGADFKNRQENNWHSEVSLRAGVQMDNLKTMLRRIQFMLEYYNGNSPNGQFHDESVEFLSLGAHVYF
ncbi:MAG: DUF1207 domain-containing protein [Nitrospiraceae bacterium]|nr:MAG: DUF1207 domain-containing protein [Nitrospiraceae bacterium]